MNSRLLPSFGLATLLCLLATPLAAWTPGTYRYTAENAARLMPKSLRAVLYTHREALFAGATRPGSDEAAAEHHLGSRGQGPDLEARILQQATRIENMLQNRVAFEEVVREMGVLCHFMADANNPLHSSDDDPREGEYFHDYSRYVESNLEKFPLVFSGYWDPQLQQGDLEGYVRKILLRSRRKYPRIGQDYIRNGRLVGSDVFDEFSFAFGIGALSTSHGVGDTAKIWLYLWKANGGDTEGLPYSSPAKAASAPATGP